MKINELFEKIQNEFQPEDLNGEIVLNGNSIVWTYKLDDNCEELEDFYSLYEDEISFDFESISSEELLREAQTEDLDKLENFIDILEETDNWIISEAEIADKVISFKIS